MNYQKDLKKVMILYPELEVLSKNDFLDLINIHNVAENTFKNDLNLELVKSAYRNKDAVKLNNINDYFYLIFKTAINNGTFKKFAYPNMQGYDDIPEQFDLEKWASLVYKIYDAVASGDMNLDNAIEYYSDTLDKKSSEDEKFKQWLKYYQDGEHLKYSKEQLKKQAFQFPLNSGGFYPNENPILPDEFSFKRKMQEGLNKDDYTEWKNKLYSAIRRLDKLLRQSDDFVDIDVQKDLSDLLHNFDQEVRSLRHKSAQTIADLSYKYANKFKKNGFNEGYSEIIKFAQETELPKNLEDSTVLPNENVAPGGQNIVNQEETDKPLSIDQSIEKSFEGGSNAREGEYEELSGPVDLHDAVSKLEEIAGRLSDRRTIRLLAEFDIMLDKIGIAAMFPELAEAQSKLIDGYSYALTRVTKMLGMLASGKSLVEISEAKKNEFKDKTQKETSKTLNPETEEVSTGNKAIQKELDQESIPQTVTPKALQPESKPNPSET